MSENQPEYFGFSVSLFMKICWNIIKLVLLFPTKIYFVVLQLQLLHLLYRLKNNNDSYLIFVLYLLSYNFTHVHIKLHGFYSMHVYDPIVSHLSFHFYSIGNLLLRIIAI